MEMIGWLVFYILIKSAYILIKSAYILIKSAYIILSK